MNRIALLLRTPDVTLSRFDHLPAMTHHDPDYEIAPHHSINFVDAGSFDVRTDDRQWQFGPGALLVTARDMGFSCTHDGDTPIDRCLSVTYGDQAVEDLLLADAAPLRPPLACVSARQTYIGHRLRSCGPGQEIRLELLAGALFESLADETRASTRVHAAGQVTQLMRRVDRAVELIEVEFGRTLTLRELAGAARLSTYHFARVFRELTGLPPHRYLTAVRLRHAANLLNRGASVTHTCYEVGFGSLSHFITAFRRRFGIVPSDLLRGARCPALRASLNAPIWRRSH